MTYKDVAINQGLMQRFVLCFVTGVLLLTVLVKLPDQRIYFLCVPFIFFVWFKRSWLWLLGIPAGFLFAFYHADQLSQFELPHALQGENLVVVGQVVNVPQQRDGGLSFTLKLHSWQSDSVTKPDKIQLNWYRGAPQIVAGDIWQLTVRLKRPHGRLNLGGSDREKYLFHQSVQATGYVRDSKPHEIESNRRLGAKRFSLNRVRQFLAGEIMSVLPESTVSGPVLALTFGLRDQMSQEQWQVFQATGTTHLMAISGLHVGLVSGLLFWLCRRLWSSSESLCLRFPAAKAAAVAALLGAMLYAAMSGMAVPAQRAALMVGIVAIAVIFDRKLFSGYLLSLAMLLILLLDPFAVLSAGFWLSFAAVAALLFVLQKNKSEKIGWQWLQIQMLLLLALLPLSIWFFQQSSLIAPLINLIAVPVTGLVVVPLLLAGTLFLPIIPVLAKPVLQMGEWVLSVMVRLFEISADTINTMITLPKPDLWVLLFAVMGIMVLLAPRLYLSKVAGAILLLPLFFNRPPGVPGNEFRVDVLDVGQGSAYVIQTSQHVMVFDPGPRYAETYEAGTSIVTPFLRARGINSLDALIVSHADKDHIGGLQGVLDNFSIERIMLPDPAALAEFDAIACQQDLQWVWDGISFTILSPQVDFIHHESNRNDGSCVLLVKSNTSSMLFTADIEQGSERVLARNYPVLAADVMTVPHHGSKTSSSEALLNLIKPDLAIVSAGYRNSFGHPKPQVIERYFRNNIDVLETTKTGMLTIHFRGDGTIETLPYRKQHRRYWHRD